MSRTLRIRPTGAAAVIGVVLGTVALAGCGAGQITQTSSQVTAVDGTNITVGDIAVRNAAITFPDDASSKGNVYSVGDSAPLELSIVNTGGTADKLISVTSPIASSVQLGRTTDIPGGTALLIEGEPPAPPVPTRAPGASGTATPAQSAPLTAVTVPPVPTGAAPTSAVAPTSSAAASGVRTSQIVLTGLREDIRPGLTYEVVFTFQRTGPVRVALPVSNSSEPRTSEAH